MANQWLRLWHDMPHDPKWRTIAKVSGQAIALVQSIYVHLLVDASRNVTRGHVTVTAEDLASSLDVTEDQVSLVLQAMQGRVMSEKSLTGWDARQPKKEEAGDGAMTSAERKRLQREREAKAALEASIAINVTTSHAMSRNVTTDKEEDKSRLEKSINTSVPNGTGGKPPKSTKAKTPAEEEKSKLWAWLKTRLVEQGAFKEIKDAGEFAGGLAQKYGNDIFLESARVAFAAEPGDLRTYFPALCATAAGKRTPLRAGPLSDDQRESINASETEKAYQRLMAGRAGGDVIDAEARVVDQQYIGGEE